MQGYVLLFLCPVDGEVLNAEALVEVGYGFGDGVDDVGDLVAYDEFDILDGMESTFAANWSPMKSPSLILIGPSKN
jgi:hypothetical protein